MIIVDSPFPPYKPVKITLGTYPDVGDISSAVRTVTVSGNRTTSQWEKDGEWHRDGDFASNIYSDKTQHFRKVNIRHRINGPADLTPLESAAASEQIRETFHLYGKGLEKSEFFRVNRLAIKHELPLWVPVIAEYFSFDFEKDGIGDFTKEAISALDVDNGFLPVEWLVKLWNVSEKDLTNHNSLIGRGGLPPKRLSEVISVVNKVVAYERTIYQKDRLTT